MNKSLATLPSLSDREAEVRRRLAGKSAAVFLDYDGTLAPIVADHRKAFLPPGMRDAVARLSRAYPVAIVSGRDLDMLRSLVQLDSVFYVGSHGFEISGPAESGLRLERGREFLSDLDTAERELRTQLASIPGHSVERKRFSIAVHFRQVADANADKIEPIVDDVLARHARLAKGFGKKVFEIRPGIDWHKGRAVLWLLEQLGLDRPDVVPIYVGDDITDEDAFRALAGRGIAIAVRDGETRPTAAEYAVENTQEVRRALEWLTQIADAGRTFIAADPRRADQ